MAASLFGPLDLDLHVEASRSEDRRVDEILAVRRPDHDHVAQSLDAVDLGEQLGDDRRLHVGRDAGAAGAEHRVHLVEEHDDRPALLALLPSALEHHADLPLGLAHVLVEQLGALDVDEVAAALLVAGRRGDLAGQAVGDRLGDERLAASRRAVEQDPLRRRQAVLGEQVGVEERQLDGVGDLLDLIVEPTDVLVGDVRHLLEQQVLDLGSGQLLEQQVGAMVEAHRVAGAQMDAAHRVGELADALLVGAPDHQCPDAVLEHLLDRDDLASDLRRAGEDDVEALVEHDLGPDLQLEVIDLRMQRHLHLAAAGEHVDRAVFVLADDHSVRRRRLGELVDLLAQRGDVVAGLTQRVRQLLVAGDRLGQLTLGLQQALLERAHPLRCLGQSRPEVLDLGDQRLDLFLWFLCHGSSSLLSEPIAALRQNIHTLCVPFAARERSQNMTPFGAAKYVDFRQTVSHRRWDGRIAVRLR